MKNFLSKNVIAICVVLVAIAYLILHKFYPSTLSTVKQNIKTYPNASVKVPEVEQYAPEYLTINQPTKKPVQTIDMNSTPLADNFSAENLSSIL